MCLLAIFYFLILILILILILSPKASRHLARRHHGRLGPMWGANAHGLYKGLSVLRESSTREGRAG